MTFVVRSKGKELFASSEEQIVDWIQRGHCYPGDFVFSEGQWKSAEQLPLVAALFAAKPEPKLEKQVIYAWIPAQKPYQSSPVTLTEAKNKIVSGEWGPSTWIFIDGDKEWRQVSAVKALKEVLPPPPLQKPSAAPAVSAVPAAVSVDEDLGLDLEAAPSLPERKIGPATNPLSLGIANAAAPKDASVSILLDTAAAAAPPGPPPAARPPTGFVSAPVQSETAPPAFVEPVPGAPGADVDAGVQYEETTKAFSALGLSLDSATHESASQLLAQAAPAGTPPAKPAAPPAMPGLPKAVPAAAAPMQGAEGDIDSFDGVTAEIPTDPIWLVKSGTSENVMGPFRFLEIVKYLEEGKLNKNDKISRQGSNRYCKIQQQYEFNVKFTIENVVENGIEKQKIFIRRRHPRASYMTPIQIQRHGQVVQASCINISAGGVLIEAPKASFALGETLSIRILPGLIPQTISCDALVIGKVPKMPPGFALKFKELKQSDKEAIDFFVQETLKKEQSRSI